MDARPQRALGAAPVVGSGTADHRGPGERGDAGPAVRRRRSVRCGPALSAGLLYCLARLPELALTAAPVLAVVVARVRTAR
ncbi:hypothetical protein ABZ299_23485 [Streptomyces sp. NPDC006184]|uniref:hypothetical protein n=1 Tax=Streptomyces sp. NPDC006184 TaxID=3155455 RepID=UPI0033B4FC2B